jgi:hypothetical protein
MPWGTRPIGPRNAASSQGPKAANTIDTPHVVEASMLTRVSHELVTSVTCQRLTVAPRLEKGHAASFPDLDPLEMAVERLAEARP